jgi:hypothetical protein
MLEKGENLQELLGLQVVFVVNGKRLGFGRCRVK